MQQNFTKYVRKFYGIRKRAVLKVRNIQKQFGHVKALRGVSVQAYQGECSCYRWEIMGSGKSTLIKILSGVLEPDEGEIEIDGKTYRTLTPRKAIDAGVSTVYQDLALGSSMDVAANLFLGREL